MRLLKQIDVDGRDATPDERVILARYSGWGALSRVFDRWPADLQATADELRDLVTDDEWKALRASTPNAHYTSLEVIDALWRGALRLGIPDDARVLEPALGVGHFLGLQPPHIAGPRFGVELEPVSARLARALYPDSAIHHGAFEGFAHLGGYDLVIGNVPFGRYGVRDPHYASEPVITRAIHDYFIGRALDEARPGGIVALITSRYTMDKANDSFRRWADQRANLVAALRLPRTAFERSAGTEVVTDILFLQRRFEGSGRGAGWIDTGIFEAKSFREPINTYFLDHPEHVLGELDIGRGMYSRYELSVEGELDLARLRHAVAQLPAGIVPPRDAPRVTFAVPELDADAPSLGKAGAYVIDQGQLARIDGSRLVPANLTGARLDRLRGMVELRDTAQALLRAQLDDEPEATLDHLRATLNQRYDTFVRRFGPLSSRTNSALFRDDPDSGLLLALEEGYDRENNTARKAALFSRRTLTPYVAPTRAGTAAEALSITLGETGRVHWPRLVTLLDKPASEVAAELGDLVFEDPARREWLTREEYLSGDVRTKLDAAITATLAEPAFERNVRALQAVQPRGLTPADIKVTLGAPWIPLTDIRAFVDERFFPDIPTDSLDIRYVEQLASWVVAADSRLTWTVANRTTWGTERATALTLLEDALNQRVPTLVDRDADGHSHVNIAETVAAREKQQQTKDAFEQWLWSDPERADRLAREYNRRFNAYRTRRYDGSHLTFPGMDRSSLRGNDLAQHQKDGVWRQLQQRTTLLALPVGAGKTYTMIAAAQEGRRLGLIRKALFVVPNALVEQWGDSFQRLYPTARVLVAGREHLAEGRRQEFMARTATSDYDAVIVAHSSFGKLPLRPESESGLLQREADRLEEAIYAAREAGTGIDRTVVKQIEVAKRRLELRIASLASRQSKDDGLRFEDLGFSAVFVDEAHAFKNLMLVTKMNRVAGLPAAESARAWDMYAKTRHVLAGGGRVVFATATPCTNTLAEVYNMQRYLQEDTLERLGIAHFDAWAATFARSVTAIELAPDGSGYRSATRFAAFNNAPELSLLFSQVTELRTEAELQLQRPELRGGRPELVVVPGSDELRTFVKSLGARAELIRARRVEPDVDNMLKVTGDGRRAALDLREVDMRPPTSRQKVDVLAERVAATWREHTATRATQVVFCDLSTPKNDRFSFYVALREALVERGLPDSEIAFIHDAATDRDKLQLFQSVNDGRVRVVMGSTEKLGTGVNIQERLIAAHHADAPWRPADVEQRNGRILRPGNSHAEVQVCYYLTEGSFDAYLWQTLETKQHFIDQLMRGEVTERTVEDIGATAALTAAECKALATGRPEIIEVVKLDTEIRRLGALQAHHADNRRHLTWDVQASEQHVVSLARDIEEWRADLATVRAARDEAGDRSPAVEIGGKRFGGDGYRKPAGQALAAITSRMQAVAMKSRDTTLVEHVGSYAGLKIHVGVKQRFDERRAVYEPCVWLRGQRPYDVNGSPDRPETLIASLEAQAHPSHIDGCIASAQRRGEEELRRIADLRRELAKPFEHDATLAQLRERRDALVSELQLRDDGDVIAAEPEAEPKRLHAPAHTADRDAAIER